MDDQEWRTYLLDLEWNCPKCGAVNIGAHEYEPGRIRSECSACGWDDLLYLWASTSWVYAPSAGVVIERD